MKTEEEPFLEAVTANRQDDSAWLVYADWLEERGDDRAEFVRLHLATRYISVDHACRPMIDHKLSQLYRDLDRKWLSLVVPREMVVQDRACWCYSQNGALRHANLRLHNERQDVRCDGWTKLLKSIVTAATDGREEFAPIREIPAHEREEIATLPKSIANLKSVRSLELYGSQLSRIPPEIGRMENLEKFVPYTSYRLHWFPYEITRCPRLRNSTVSTRAIYGNFKNRAPFPRLIPWRNLPGIRRASSICTSVVGRQAPFATAAYVIENSPMSNSIAFGFLAALQLTYCHSWSTRVLKAASTRYHKVHRIMCDIRIVEAKT